MSLFTKVSGLFQKKEVNGAIFGFFSNASLPHMVEKEYHKAYRGWTYACVNAFADALNVDAPPATTDVL